jgi:hypothetical protein
MSCLVHSGPAGAANIGGGLRLGKTAFRCAQLCHPKQPHPRRNGARRPEGDRAALGSRGAAGLNAQEIDPGNNAATEIEGLWNWVDSAITAWALDLSAGHPTRYGTIDEFLNNSDFLVTITKVADGEILAEVHATPGSARSA